MSANLVTLSPGQPLIASAPGKKYYFSGDALPRQICYPELAKHNSGDILGAVSNLQALLNAVEAQSGKRLTVEQAELLTGFADNTILELYQEFYCTE